MGILSSPTKRAMHCSPETSEAWYVGSYELSSASSSLTPSPTLLINSSSITFHENEPAMLQGEVEITATS